MKTKILLASIILFSLILIIYFTNNQDTKPLLVKKEHKKTNSEPENNPLEENIIQKRIYNFQILPTTEIDVRFPKDGILEFSTKENTSFKKNDLLFQLNTSQQFEEIYSKKTELKALIAKRLEQKENADWQLFLSEIKENDLLPNLKDLNIDFSSSNEIKSLIETINKLEKEILSNFYLAKFDGKVKFLQTKNKVFKGETIAQIYPTTMCVLLGKIHKNDSSFFAKNRLLHKNEKIQILPTNHPDSLLVKNKINKKQIKNYDFFDFFQRSNEN
jgi:hypothetical protein